MVTLIVNNNKTKIEGPGKLTKALYDKWGVRNPNAFYIRRFMQPGWDGKVHYLTDAGYIQTGLLPDLIADIRKLSPKEIIDVRLTLGEKDIRSKVPEKLKGFTPRDYQLDAIRSITDREVEGIQFPRGIIKAATNSGKNLIFAFIYKTFKVPTISIFNRKEYFETALKEMSDLLGADNVGVINSKTQEWKPFMIAMAQTLNANWDYYKAKLSRFEACFVDECDLADNKTYKNIISALYNTYIRVGASGTYAASPLSKFRIRDTNIKAFFSGIVYEIKNTELMEMGHSCEVVIKIHKGNEEIFPDYTSEYNYGIILNKERNKIIAKVASLHIKRNHMPMLVMYKNHKHGEVLHKQFVKKFPGLRIEVVHHKTKNRTQLVKDFTAGKIDILIGSLILARAKNFPLMQALINAASGDSSAQVLQILGRATRTHSSKERTYFDDFWDEGNYLKKHSKHRVMTLKREGLEVIELYK